MLTLTNGVSNTAGAAWFNTPVSTGSFQASFTYTAAATADGTTFVLQNDPRGLNALGAARGSLGYGGSGGTAAVSPSVAYQLNIYKGNNK